MSDPVTHADIEDVLSSIRRLVRNSNKTTEQSPALTRATVPTGRLVLTPALRVSDPIPEETQSRTVDSEGSTGSPAKAHAIDPPVAPEAKHIHVETSDDVECLTGGVDDFKGVVTEFTSKQSPSSLIRRAREEIAGDLSVETATTVQDGSTISATPSEDKIACAQQDVASQDTDLQDEAPWRDPSTTLFAAAGADEHVKAGAASARAAAVLRRIAELETAQKEASINGQTAPGAETLPKDAQDEVSATVPPSVDESLEDVQWEDHLDVSKSHKHMDQPEITETVKPISPESRFARRQAQAQVKIKGGAKNNTSPVTADEELLDEETLRELVAEIVRNELQGPLGERITRNVRKLVRREIQRALAAQELF